MSLNDILQDFMRKLSGPAYIEDLFTNEFVQSHTNATSIKDLLGREGIVDQTTFDKWVKGDADAFCQDNTDFASYGAMENAAAKELLNVRKQRSNNGEAITKPPVDQNPFSLISIEVNYVAK